MNPIPTLGNAYHLVAKDERQRTISGEKKAPPESAAFKAFKPVRRENNVSQNKTVPKYQKRGDTEEKCYKSGRSGHTRYGCFKIIGYLDWWPGKVKPIAAHVETEASPVPETSHEDLDWCDNGGEFTSNEMTDFYNERGILLEITCPHTPQQNGVVERKHRHILEVARSLRFEANLPKRFWGECILTALTSIKLTAIKEKFPFKSDDLIYEEVDALEPFNKPICNEIKNHVKPTIDEVHVDESTSSVETNRNSVVNEPSESDGTNDTDEHNVNPTLNENEAKNILSETLVQSETTEGNEAQPDIPEELTRVKRNKSQPARLSDYHLKLPHRRPCKTRIKWEASLTFTPMSNCVI
ncbi:putative reverse transcriptase, RNA-dependent DNA polymerase, LTR copia-type gag-polypeptide [Tanacetum coccineum]